MKTFEALIAGHGSIFVDAQNDVSAKWRAAALFRLVGVDVYPYQVTVWEIS